MRDSWPFAAVAGSAMIGLPPAESAAPRMKSICPPMPEKIRWPIESAQTWPVRSISSAELIATTRGLRRISAVSLVRSQGWNSTCGLSSTKSNSRLVPFTNDVTVRFGMHDLVPVGDHAVQLQIDQAVREHLGVDAEFELVAEAPQHRVRDPADAHLQRRAVLDEVGDQLADGGLDGGFRRAAGARAAADRWR